MSKKKETIGVIGTTSKHQSTTNAQEEKVNTLPTKLGSEPLDNDRLKLGYSRAAWKRVKKCHVAIDERNLETLTNYFSASVKLGGELDSREQIELLSKYDRDWRGFIKDYILNSYPNPGESKIRIRLLNTFQDSVGRLRNKSGVKKVETE